MTRLVLFHYHLFKNAGTSVDKILQENFGSRWLSREFEERPAEQHAHELLAWLLASPEALAFSSHTAQLPPPRHPEIQVFPVVFVRHPLDRIASAYHFERRQIGDTGFGAMLAQHTTLAGYVKARLAMPQDRQCRNFHTERLARMFGPEYGSEAARAMAALQALPFVGLVDQWEPSLRALQALIAPAFPGFRVFEAHENMSQAGQPDALPERLNALRDTMGPALFDELTAANADDLALYEAAQRGATEWR